MGSELVLLHLLIRPGCCRNNNFSQLHPKTALHLWFWWLLIIITIILECRDSHLMNKCQTSLELFSAIWFVMGNVWVFDSRFGSYHRAPKLHVLCVSLLAWNALSYLFPFLLFLLLCCCVPLISTAIGYNMSAGSAGRGASDDQISRLPSWRYKAADTKSEFHSSADCDSAVASAEDLVSPIL